MKKADTAGQSHEYIGQHGGKRRNFKPVRLKPAQQLLRSLYNGFGRDAEMLVERTRRSGIAK